MRFLTILPLVVGIIACALAIPQYNVPSSNSGSISNTRNYVSASSNGGSSNGGSSTNGGSSSGGTGQLVTQCTTSDGTKFTCAGVNKADITLRSEHILWLPGGGGDNNVYDIEVPNYSIEELIKAGFKKGQGSNTNINVLLKKPEQTYEAQTGKPEITAGQTSVKLQYEPVSPVKVHFPNDKPYQPLSGPVIPPSY